MRPNLVIEGALAGMQPLRDRPTRIPPQSNSRFQHTLFNFLNCFSIGDVSLCDGLPYSVGSFGQKVAISGRILRICLRYPVHHSQ